MNDEINDELFISRKTLFTTFQRNSVTWSVQGSPRQKLCKSGSKMTSKRSRIGFKSFIFQQKSSCHCAALSRNPLVFDLPIHASLFAIRERASSCTRIGGTRCLESLQHNTFLARLNTDPRIQRPESNKITLIFLSVIADTPL